MRILVVDDDRIVLESCRRILEPEGHEVVEAASAREALHAFEACAQDLLLVDVKMPVRDGFSLMDEVLRRWPGTRIVVMSGYPTAETVSDGLALGAVDFIAKPFSPDELIQVVQATITQEARHGTT